MWINGFRGHMLKLNNQGLIRLCLSKNKLTSGFVFNILPILNYDQYLKELDVSHNNIEQKGVSYLLDWIESSKHVINLEVKGNPGYNLIVRKKIRNILMRNIKNITKEKKSIKKNKMFMTCTGRFKKELSKKKLHKKKIRNIKKKISKNPNTPKVLVIDPKIKTIKSTKLIPENTITEAPLQHKHLLNEDYKSIIMPLL